MDEAEVGKFSDAMDRLKCDSLVRPNPENILALLLKHPRSNDSKADMNQLHPDWIQLDKKIFLKTVLIQWPLRWGGFGAQSSAAICGQAFNAGWVLVCNDLELLYPGVSTAVHGQDGILAAQFKSALENVRLDVEKANVILGSAAADAPSLPPKTCLTNYSSGIFGH